VLCYFIVMFRQYVVHELWNSPRLLPIPRHGCTEQCSHFCWEVLHINDKKFTWKARVSTAVLGGAWGRIRVNVFIPSFSWSVTTDRHVGYVSEMWDSYDCVCMSVSGSCNAPCGARGTVAVRPFTTVVLWFMSLCCLLFAIWLVWRYRQGRSNPLWQCHWMPTSCFHFIFTFLGNLSKNI